MSTKYNHEKLNNKIKGLRGDTCYPQAVPERKPPEQWQLDWIEEHIKLLLEHGVDARKVVQPIRTGYYKLQAAAAVTAINSICTLCRRFGIEDIVWNYIILCKNKETGKRVKYRTTKARTCPKGYEYIGELYRELVPRRAG